MIKFEVAKGFEDKGVNLPKRGTTGSAGYDFEVAEDVVIQPQFINGKGTLVKTGIKAIMPENLYLALHPRSSLYNKKGLLLANGVGVIDSDYANNPDNDGNIMLNFINLSTESVTLLKGEKVGQGIFHEYFTVCDDNADGVRNGGFGSTGGTV